jgi:hypothetical protein
MEEIINRLREIDTEATTLSRANFEGSPYAADSDETAILEYKTDQPFALRNGARYRIVPVVRETFTTDGNNDQDTFNLSADIIDSDVSDDLVLYEGDQRVSEDSVDYANDSFDYTDNGTGDDLTAYYVSATQANLKLKKVGPGGSNGETLVRHDAGLLNRRDPNRDPLTLELDASPLQAVVPADYTLKWTISGSYSAGWDPDTDPEPVNLIVSVPINRAVVEQVEGLASAVAVDSSERV